MMTATWWENSALMVGMPRRSTEWSTESSWTKVARWISSTTAASVTARGSSAPAAWRLSSSSVGRNSFPFIRSRWSLTSAMIGKSAAMMRRSSPATRSSSAATGCWMSRNETGATCWLTSLGARERLGALAHVHEPDIHREHAPVQVARLRLLAQRLEGPAQPVEDPHALLVARRRQLQRATQDRLRHAVRALLDEAHAERLRAPELALGRPQRLLQLGDGLVHQAHLLERDAEVVVRLEVGLVDVLVDPLLEAREHVLEVLLLVARRLLVCHLHARVARGQFLVEDHRAQVHELTLVRRRFVAHLQLRVLGRGPPFRRLPLRRGRRRRRRREHAERRLGALIVGIVLRDALVHRPRLLGEVAAQQRVGQLEVGVDQLHLVARLERELHLLLAVPHAVRVEVQDLVHEVPRLLQVAEVLEPGGGVIQLLDAALALALLDQRFPEGLVRLGIVRVVRDPGFELVDGGLGRPRLGVREHERAGLLTLVHPLVDTQIDVSRPASRGA